MQSVLWLDDPSTATDICVNFCSGGNADVCMWAGEEEKRGASTYLWGGFFFLFKSLLVRNT